MTPVDLRSDTVTKPTPAMRRAMAEAEVGDDVYGEDPTVNHLQKRAAEIFEKEAALFVPTGCMGNLLAIKGWAPPTSEVICEQRAHINLYELASISAIAGCLPRPTPALDGILTWTLIEPLIRPLHGRGIGPDSEGGERAKQRGGRERTSAANEPQGDGLGDSRVRRQRSDRLREQHG